jgi:hypothetical protein
MGATASVSSTPTGVKSTEVSSGANAQRQGSVAYAGGVVGLPIRAQYTPYGRQDAEPAYRPTKLVNEAEPWRLYPVGTELWEVYLSRTSRADEVAARVRARAKFGTRNWTSFCYSIFAALDRDGNGVLRQSEWGRVVLKIFEYVSADINKETGAPSVAELRELERTIADCLRAEVPAASCTFVRSVLCPFHRMARWRCVVVLPTDVPARRVRRACQARLHLARAARAGAQRSAVPIGCAAWDCAARDARAALRRSAAPRRSSSCGSCCMMA